MYTPPFTVSAKAINLIAEISAQIERYSTQMEQSDSLRAAGRQRILSSLKSKGIIRRDGAKRNGVWDILI